MSIRTKFLSTLYVYIIVVAILLLGFAYYHHGLVSKRIDSILNYQDKLEIVSQLELSLAKLLMPANDYLIHGNEEERFLFKDINTEVNRIFRIILEDNNFSIQIAAGEHEALSRLKDKYIVVRSIAEKILSIHDPVGNAEGAVIMEEMDSMVDDMLNDMNAFHRNSRFNVFKEIEAIDAYFYKYMIFVLSISAVTGMSTFFYGFFLARWIISPIKRLVQHIGFVKDGDYGRKLDVKTKDEIGFLATSFNDMTSQLGESKRQIEDYALNLEQKVEDKISEVNKAKEFTESLIETAQDAIICINEDETINVWNKSAEKIFGYSKSDIIGQSVSTIIPEKYKKQHQEGMKRFLKTHKPIIIGKTIEISGLSREGSEMPIEMSLSCLKSENKRYTFTAIIRDITEKKRVEAERKHMFDELTYKNKDMEQIIYVTSHDLRSPLLNIQGFSRELVKDIELVRKKLNENTTSSEAKEKLAHTLEEDIPDALRFILASSSKMDTLLSGLLRLSRMGRVVLNIKRLDMNKLMANVVEAFEYKIKEAGITLHVDELPSCNGDEVQIGQVFSNLLDNALKYLDPDRKGVIRISGTRQLVYCVEDNGIGIAEGHQDKVFEIFHRLHPGDSVAGEGLGLTIIRRILDRHGGRIWVESKPGKGSKFFVSLPE